MIVETEMLCQILGCSERAVGKWVAQGLPVRRRGGEGRGDASEYETGEVIRWLRNRAVDQAIKDRPTDRLRRAQAQIAELELAERQGGLVAVGEIEEVWGGAILAARADLLNLPARLKAALDARYGISVDELMLEEPVHDALRKLAENPPADDEDVEAADPPADDESDDFSTDFARASP